MNKVVKEFKTAEIAGGCQELCSLQMPQRAPGADEAEGGEHHDEGNDF